jgi:hypothetical protein
MFGAIVLLVVTGVASFAIIDALKRKFRFIDAAFLKNLFYYHTVLATAYFLYVTFNPSDSKAYYSKVFTDYRGDSWMSFYGTSTTFIEFLAYPFIKYIEFSYESMMVLFSFAGFLGFVYMYILFKEHVQFSHQFMGMDLVKFIFLLPNLHFWSSSLGKGSVIFLGIGLYFFGIRKVNTRIVATVVGGVIIYHVRPHIMLVLLVSSAMGFIFSSKGVSVAMRVVFLLGSCVAFFFIYRDVLSLVNINEDEFISQGLDLTHRASELSKATSGVDISNYSLPLQVFTFLFRPLFFDAPGALGLIVSVENVIYLVLAFKILNLRGLRFLIRGDFMVKSAILSFIAVSIALAQISGNLGLAMRQKSQVMILFLFVITLFLDHERLKHRRPRVQPPRAPSEPRNDTGMPAPPIGNNI